jgi:hypothetical protein
MKEKEKKEAFIKFLHEHPELRLWQAIYAFTKAKLIELDGRDPFFDK